MKGEFIMGENKNNIYTKPLFCICGETSSGKDTLIRMIMNYFQDVLKPVCSHTSRPMREGEVDGREHYFDSHEEFQRIKKENSDKILAYTKIESKENHDGYEYMALLDELDHANVYIIDPLGLKYLKEHFGDRITNIVVIYITAPLQERVLRARSRSDFNTQFKKRVMNEYEQFLDFNINQEYDYVIKNYDDRCTESFEVLVSIIQKYL